MYLRILKFDIILILSPFQGKMRNQCLNGETQIASLLEKIKEDHCISSMQQWQQSDEPFLATQSQSDWHDAFVLLFSWTVQYPPEKIFRPPIFITQWNKDFDFRSMLHTWRVIFPWNLITFSTGLIRGDFAGHSSLPTLRSSQHFSGAYALWIGAPSPMRTALPALKRPYLKPASSPSYTCVIKSIAVRRFGTIRTS